MNELSAYPITRKWPARHSDRLQLYPLPTPNGVKVSILLEETGDLVGIDDFPNVTRALGAFVVRPAVELGLTIPKAP